MIVIVLASPAKFPLGQTVITANANAILNPEAVQEGLRRHASGDWGNVCKEDAELNDEALKDGSRLLSVYGEGESKFWIITEADRSVTTVLMRDDY